MLIWGKRLRGRERAGFVFASAMLFLLVHSFISAVGPILESQQNQYSVDSTHLPTPTTSTSPLASHPTHCQCFFSARCPSVPTISAVRCPSVPTISAFSVLGPYFFIIPFCFQKHLGFVLPTSLRTFKKIKTKIK